MIAPIYLQATTIIDELPVQLPGNLERNLRRADNFIRLAVLAGSGLLESRLDLISNPSQAGIFLGTTTGSLETNFRFLDTMFDDGEGQASPTLFSHSVHNLAAGYLAKTFNLQGQALSLTSWGWPFLRALAEARSALLAERLEVALVLAVEEQSPVIAGIHQDQEKIPAGVVAWLLTKNQAKAQFSLVDLQLLEKHCPPEKYFQRTEEVFSFSDNCLLDENKTLNCPRSLTAALNHGELVRGPWSAQAPWGEAKITIRKCND